LNIASQLKAAAAERILIKDGAYGTQIQARRLGEADYRGAFDLGRDQKGNNDLLNLTRPELIGAIASDFAAAGAEILATNSFNANRISMADYGAEHLVRDINVAAARIIGEAARAAEAKDGRRRFVAGALGPTNKTLSLSPDVNAENRPRASDHALDDDHRPVWPESLRPLHRGILGVGAACAPAFDRAQLLVRRGPAARAYRQPVADRGLPDHGLSQCRAAERSRRI
jgi:hypothetical protein